MMGIGLGLVTLGNIPVLGSIIGLFFVVTISTLIGFVEWVSKLPNAITTGFRLALWEVALLYLALGLLLLGLYSARKIWIYTSVFTLLFFIGYQSFHSIRDAKSAEVLIINANDPTFFIRRGKQGDLIVMSNKENIEEKTDFLKRALDVYYGIDTKLHFVARKNGNITTTIPGLEFFTKPALIHLKMEDRTYTLIYGDYFKDQDLLDADVYIGGPWVSQDIIHAVAEKKKIWMMKDKGAFRVKL